MTVKAGILLYLLYLLLEIFLALFLGLPSAFAGIMIILQGAKGSGDDPVLYFLLALFATALAAVSFLGVYQLDKRRRKLSQKEQDAQLEISMHNIQLQANAEEAKRALEAVEKERDALKSKVQILCEQISAINQSAIRAQIVLDQDEAEQRAKLQGEIQDLKNERDALKNELDSIDQESVISFSHPETSYRAFNVEDVKNALVILRAQQDNMIKTGAALSVTNHNKQRVVNSQIKQILRCFNAECDNIISNVSARNIDSSREKIQRAFDANNRIFLIDGVQLTLDYLAAKLDELNAVYAYHLKLEEEKEQKRAIREQMVEEEKVRREIEREKKKIERDQQQFEQELRRLMKYMQKTASDVEKQLYIDKIHELEEKLHALEENKKVVLNRENNAKAGFVYIISNIGSFGEHVFKIGMTRRLEPMDRIAELSSASVPFPFDVHAMIFSENAPELEAMLHRHFESRKVNKVNSRKEFFRVDLEEIKKLVIEQFGNTVQFTDTPPADEYRETLRLEELSK